MSKRAKTSLIHGVINIILPLLLVALHSGIFANLSGDNPWNFFLIGAVLTFFPILSSLAGILFPPLYS